MKFEIEHKGVDGNGYHRFETKAGDEVIWALFNEEDFIQMITGCIAREIRGIARDFSSSPRFSEQDRLAIEEIGQRTDAGVINGGVFTVSIEPNIGTQTEPDKLQAELNQLRKDFGVLDDAVASLAATIAKLTGNSQE